jgi:hypothetical protein
MNEAFIAIEPSGSSGSSGVASDSRYASTLLNVV